MPDPPTSRRKKPAGWRAKAKVWMPDGARIEVDFQPAAWVGPLLLILMGARRGSPDQLAKLRAIGEEIDPPHGARDGG